MDFIGIPHSNKIQHGLLVFKYCPQLQLITYYHYQIVLACFFIPQPTSLHLAVRTRHRDISRSFSIAGLSRQPTENTCSSGWT